MRVYPALYPRLYPFKDEFYSVNEMFRILSDEFFLSLWSLGSWDRGNILGCDKPAFTWLTSSPETEILISEIRFWSHQHKTEIN